MRYFAILLALVIAIASAIAYWMWSNQPQEPAQVVVAQPEPQQVQVPETVILVARRNIPVGTRLSEADIDRQTWPQHLVHAEFIPDGSQVSLIDMVTRTPFQAREPFALSRLANPNDPSFLAAQLPPGMRAVTIPVDAITGVNGFVSPGDRVDILIKHEIGLDSDFVSDADLQSRNEGDGPSPKAVTTQRLPKENRYRVPLLMTENKRSSRPTLTVSEVLISNVKILAVGTQSYQYENSKSAPTNVTVQVTDLQAQKLRHADLGNISLAMRSLEDSEDQSLPRPVADADMTRLTPPSFFPFLYPEGDYDADLLDLTTIEYDQAEEEGDNGALSIGDTPTITIIRGVEKETMGVEKSSRNTVNRNEMVHEEAYHAE